MSFYVDVLTDITSTELTDDEFAVLNGLCNLYTCKPGAREQYPDFGIDLDQYLQDPADDVTSNKIRITLFQQTTKWETRVSLGLADITVTPFSDAMGGFYVALQLYIPKLNKYVPLDFNLLRRR